jgi:hypothetical protein
MPGAFERAEHTVRVIVSGMRDDQNHGCVPP